MFAHVGARTRRKGDTYTLAVDIVGANEGGTAARTSLIHLIIYLLVSIDLSISLRRQSICLFVRIDKHTHKVVLYPIANDDDLPIA